MNQLLIGIDAGTTNIKAVAFSVDGRELYTSSRKTPIRSPQPGWKQQNMHDVWDQTTSVIYTVAEKINDEDEVIAVGVTGQGGGTWLLNEDGIPVRDAILWNDGRAADYVDKWKQTGLFDRIFDRCGHGLQPGLPISILRWLKENEPEKLQEASTSFFCKDWLKYKLTGTRTTDPSEASVGYISPETGELADEILEEVGIPEVIDLIPPIEPGSTITGEVTDEASETTGLPSGIPVVSGVMDVVACAFGSGTVTPGHSSSIVGTTLQNQTLLENPVIDSTPVGYTLSVGIDGMGLRALGAMTGTPNIDWVLDVVSKSDNFVEVEETIRNLSVGSGGVLFHPYLNSSGEKAPFVDTAARAQFTGISTKCTWAHLVRAVYEGVALSMRDCYAHIPYDTTKIYLSGGGARSDFWCQLFADCLGAQVITQQGNELGAKGVALLAGIAVNQYEGLEDASNQTMKIDEVYQPRERMTSKYNTLYDIYVESRNCMSSLWKRNRKASQAIKHLQ